ncbi:alcohol dehydrogenase [Gluconobacter japonicus]|uniref:Cytochrome c n=1 Tax=Gluconobacter japonicus TaxID=376620 RepID=A0A9Q2FNF9_GLUJA|nr:cytochrome c [Gluconobacter japonicus]KXV40519.1 alcohol dehydrogenase [Gluconobacter japonicus]KXV42515.1 alcohol dehydrogenase [Gluconobacter japonicus]MBF0871735.1 cytochrome c [Gluconobacter japonicus]
MKIFPILAFACSIFALSHQTASANDDKTTLREEGRYLAAASDCAACHSIKNKPEYSGGVSFTLPIGTIYSTNITPDMDHGIGKYTEAEFGRALREGVRRDGSTLYPAMPYPSYARLTDHDIHALYTYFHESVPAAAIPTPENGIQWPFSMRWPLMFWRWAFSPAPVKAQEKTLREFADAQMARGAYLVEGPAHCGACHSPRGLAMQEKALTASDSPSFLAGGALIDGWIPTSLRQENRTGLGRWSEQDIVDFLKTGRNMQGESFGAMTSAIVHGTQHLSDSDLHAMAKYLRALQPFDRTQTNWVYDPTATNALRKADVSARGAKLYVDNCAACHRTDGKGYPAVFPPLAGNPVVMGKDPASLVHIVQVGATLPKTETAPSAFTMPDFMHRLNDQQVADVVTFIRHAWGNNAPAVSAEDVARLRKDMPPRNMADGEISLN